MKKLRFSETRRVRPARSAVWVVAVSAALAGTTGTVSAQGNAAADAPAHVRAETRFKRPKLAHGLLRIRGTGAGETVALRLQAGRPDMLEVDVADDGCAEFRFKREKVAKIAVDARAGDDSVRIDDSHGAVNAGIPTTIDGGDGSDTIAGGTGVEMLFGGEGVDTIDGNGGNDVASMGTGDDVFVWDPGDGSDVVEGQDGTDTMIFNGAAVAEQVELSANASRVRFFRNPGAITMDTAGVERIDFNAFGGPDDVTVNDLTGTDLGTLILDLGVGGTGDGQADRVVVDGTDGDDAIDVSGDAAVVKVSGLTVTEILHSEVAGDQLTINTLAGTDTVVTDGLTAGSIQLFVDGVLVAS